MYTKEMPPIDILSTVDRSNPRFVDPFDGMFSHGAPSVESDSIIQHPLAQKLFDSISWGQSENLYWYQQPLEATSGPHVWRVGCEYIMLSSYDYLGLIGHPSVTKASIEAIQRYGTGTGGVRLLTGTSQIHLELEHRLTQMLGTEAALTFSSGYTANVGIIGALFSRGDIALIDANAHRSIVDGCRLSGATIKRFRHNDLVHLEQLLKETAGARKRLVAVDGVYSMDGDLCPLPELLKVVRRNHAFLLVDDAHATGMIGTLGAGTASHYGIDPNEIDLITGSLNKAIPAGGGFVAGRRATIAYLQHIAGPYFFSAALSPASAGAAIGAIGVMQNEPDRFERLHRHSVRLRNGLSELGYDIGRTKTAIIPVIVGSSENAYRISRDLLNNGIIASAVIPPAVAQGTARLRLCATAAHSDDDISSILSAFKALAHRSDT